ncbi:MAG: HAD family hydrolase [Atopobiaceae bacterium]|jgi:FMN phosphatase YigB (HAD superfamily)|nr:HAD family hydrolase [Atopobiaceae bacterium]MCI2173447.1 HAD family hydrolase [Atopobiaceae bacterium]MCI2207442.1 HAD family hydrolase [Atopobiaceae bacterium]
MIKAVLFDMDDTLLSINLTAFIASYVSRKARLLAEVSSSSVVSMGMPFARSYLAISSDSRQDSLTNEQLFNETFLTETGIPLDDPVIADAVDCFDAEVTPTLNGRTVHAVPRRGGRKAVEAARKLGLTVALATNPSFSEACVRARMGWADVEDVPFARISHMANSTRMKPDARYYEEFVSALGLSCEECLMVGNDATRDFPRPDCGLVTAYVGHARPKRAIWRGDMERLSRDLPFLIDRLDGDRSRGMPDDWAEPGSSD